MPVRTPCIGVCSTTYGDLVCRGCKRFAHEIVEWNGYSDDQRLLIRDRLERLKWESARLSIRVDDRVEVARTALALRISLDQPIELVACEILKKTGMNPSLLGIATLPDGGNASPTDFVRAVEGEFLRRSEAHYEHAFRTRLRPW